MRCDKYLNNLKMKLYKLANKSIKTAVLLVVVFFGLSTFSNAQDQKLFRFGLKVSPNAGWYKPDTKGMNANGSQLGFGYGLMGEFAIAQSYNYSVLTGIEINSNSGRLRFADVIEPTTAATALLRVTNNASYQIRYLDIPLAIKMKTNEIGYFTYFANFGINTGMRLRARMNENFDLATGTLSNNNVDILKNTQPLKVALVIGGGLEYNLHAKTSLMVGITYSNSFTNNFKQNYYEVDSKGDVILINGQPNSTVKMKSYANFISLDFGIFF